MMLVQWSGRPGLYRMVPQAAAGFFLYFAIALLVLHAIRPEYTIVDHMISDYAVGRLGWIMTSAFCALSLGCFLLAIGLFRDGPRSWLARVGAALLVVASAGLIVTALFPTDLETAPSTRTGDIHAISFLVNVVCVLASTLCLAVSFRGDSRWGSRFGLALAFATLLVASFLAQFLTLHRGAPYGITNRLFVLVLLAWLLSNCFWLAKASGQRNDLDDVR